MESGRASKNNAPTYCYDEAQLQAHLATLPEGASKSIQRFKGLGEMMPEQLWSTTLNPETRLLKRLTVEDAAMANKTFQLLMSDKVAPRRSSSRRRDPSSRTSTCETIEKRPRTDCNVTLKARFKSRADGRNTRLAVQASKAISAEGVHRSQHRAYGIAEVLERHRLGPPPEDGRG